MVARNRVILGGNLGTDETWSIGLTMLPAGGVAESDQSVLEGWATAIQTAMAVAFPTVLETALGNDNDLTDITVQYYGETGGVVAQATATTTAVNGASSDFCPRQTAVVFSLQTGQPGGSFRGRTYWPGCGVQLGSNGRLATSTSNVQLLDGFIDLLDLLSAAFPGEDGAFVQVYSPTLDLLTAVSTIRCGDVPDTQRRRRDNMIESYASAGAPGI